MKRLISHLSKENIGELNSKIDIENNTVVLYYLLQSNCKKKRRLKVMTIEKDNEWYIANSIISFSNNRHIKKLEVHEEEFNILIENVNIIINLFSKIRKWIKSITDFHVERFPLSVRVINDLDFMYKNNEISYRFSVNPGGLVVRAKLINYSKDTFEVLKAIAEKCNSYRGMCVIEGTNTIVEVEHEVVPKRCRS